jgi:hypothetical protein
MLHEEALSAAIPYESLGLGEPVIVVTRMGTLVAKGKVMGVFPYGAVQVREYDLERGGSQAISDRVYDTDLYLFLAGEEIPSAEIGDPDAAEVPVLLDPEMEAPAISDVVSESAQSIAPPKLHRVDGDWIVYPDGTRYHKSVMKAGMMEQDWGWKIDEAEEAEPAAEKPAPKQKEVRKDDRTASAKVDVNSLPKDLQKRLRGVGDLDEDARDRVLSAISEAAMRAFKAVGVKDTEVYGRIVKLQEVIKPVLEGK